MRSLPAASGLTILALLAGTTRLDAQEVTVSGAEEWALGALPPGAPPFDAALGERLAKAWAARPGDYQPRTRQRRADGSPLYANRLLLESSPYLRQHAHNPVDWFPWGDEAFARAAALKRPVLLSVGYSTCHWCHVMEEESFDDEEIARFLNENYVAIKVDREERPDVDAVYMSAVQSLTGRGGWPMTVWLTSERKPFFAGTYFPARDGDRGTPTGFLSLLRRLREVHDQDPQRVADTAARILRSLQASLQPSGASGAVPGIRALDRAVEACRAQFDHEHGGLGRAPKFPSSLPLRALLRSWRRTGDATVLHMVTLTLERMAMGGLYDHVGGGFHRYSTDARWLVPHFEKMLYDNALLVSAYVEAYLATGRAEFARVVRETLRYVEREMTAPEGAFYSATDADSARPDGHQEEGWFFTWTPAEIDAALGPERGRAFAAQYGVTAAGNFEGRSILHLSAGLGGSAPFDADREVLYRVRGQRPAPLRDAKVLACWNGLMIAALSRAGLALGDEAYVRRAARAADFVLTRMRTEDGRLQRISIDGRARGAAFVEDYAFVVAGLIDLYEATGELRWLREAVALDAILGRDFEDGERGGYFRTGHDHEALLAREKPSYDGAEPSGASVQALNLLRLHELTADDPYRERAEKTLRASAAVLERSPLALGEMLLALDFHLDAPKEIVVVVPRARAEAEPFLAELRRTFLPNRVLAVVVGGSEQAAHAALVPLVRDKVARDGAATAYVCEGRVCDLPTTDPAVFAQQLRGARAKVGRSETPR